MYKIFFKNSFYLIRSHILGSVVFLGLVKQCLTGEFVLIEVNKDTLAKHMQIFTSLLRCHSNQSFQLPPNASLSPWESTECNEKALADGRQEAHQRGYRVARGYDNVRSLPVQIQSSTLQQEKQSQRKEAKEELKGFGLMDVSHLCFKKFFFDIYFPSYIYNDSFYPFVTLFRGSA